MAIDYPSSPSVGDHHTHGGKTWTFHDGKWALNVSVEGVRGPAGVAFQGTAPTTTDVLWADTSVSGVAVVPTGGTTGQMLAKASSTSYDAVWATPVTSADLALKANLASPTFTGTPTLPTGTIATTQTAGNNSTAVATTAYTDSAVAALVDSAPATLNTLDELALALGDDANFATTTATSIGLKAPLASPTFTGTVTGSPAAGTISTGTSGLGYMGLPQNSATTGAYGIVAADAGLHIYSSATRTVTIPANATIAMPVGATIVFVAGSGATVTIAITSDTMYLAGPGTTGSRTLAPFGMATAIKITSTSWMISGNGLT